MSNDDSYISGAKSGILQQEVNLQAKCDLATERRGKKCTYLSCAALILDSLLGVLLGTLDVVDGLFDVVLDAIDHLALRLDKHGHVHEHVV